MRRHLTQNGAKWFDLSRKWHEKRHERPSLALTGLWICEKLNQIGPKSKGVVPGRTNEAWALALFSQESSYDGKETQNDSKETQRAALRTNNVSLETQASDSPRKEPHMNWVWFRWKVALWSKFLTLPMITIRLLSYFHFCDTIMSHLPYIWCHRCPFPFLNTFYVIPIT